MNKVLLTGRLTRDPELRSLASGSSVATFAVATNEFRGNGKERAEYHNVVVWDRLAQVCGQYLGKRPVSTLPESLPPSRTRAAIRGRVCTGRSDSGLARLAPRRSAGLRTLPRLDHPQVARCGAGRAG